MGRRGRYEFYESTDRLWYWRFRASNGQITKTGAEGFDSEYNVKRAILVDRLPAPIAALRKINANWHEPY